jgi:tetratricopeptide (TPR) repeat protein
MMIAQRRLLAAFALTVAMGFVVILVVQDRNFEEALPLVLVLLLTLVAAQYAVLFGLNRRGRQLNAAQRAFLEGRFDEVIQHLEEEPPTVKSLTLMGNAYRMKGDTQRSTRILQEAVRQGSDDPFPLYGLGRVLLVQGEYEAAAAHMQKALSNGARKATRVELALALYLAQDEAAQDIARQAGRILRLEEYRALMLNYILFKLEQQPSVAVQVMKNTADGLAFWEAEAERHRDTGYGQDLRTIISEIEHLLGGEVSS